MDTQSPFNPKSLPRDLGDWCSFKQQEIRELRVASNHHSDGIQLRSVL